MILFFILTSLNFKKLSYFISSKEKTQIRFIIRVNGERGNYL